MAVSSVYSFGRTNDGQLGLGALEANMVLQPSLVSRLLGKEIVDVSSSFNHTIFLTTDGLLYSCGNNDYGQLGRQGRRTIPERIEILERQKIVQVCCGWRHSVALSEEGEMFSWGNNDKGQLGYPYEAYNSTPTIIRWNNSSSVKIIQISCGYNHNVALSDVGDVYTWGSNENNELGNGENISFSVVPRKVRTLFGLPIAMIASGACHSFVLTVTGNLLGWGCNRYGQLGTGDTRSRSVPEICKTVRTLNLVYISCGESHSCALTKDGGVFTFGAGNYGQLGHNRTQSETNPLKVFEFMGNEVSMVACGRNHTLVYVSSTNKLYAFGLGNNGQLGNNNHHNLLTPTYIETYGRSSPTYSPNDSKSSKYKPSAIKSLFAGGDQTFLVVYKDNNAQNSPTDHRKYSSTQPIRIIDRTLIQRVVRGSSEDKPLVDDIVRIFSSLSSINASFLFSKQAVICDSKRHGADIDKAKRCFEYIYNCRSGSLRKKIEDTLEKNLMLSILESASSSSSPPSSSSTQYIFKKFTSPKLHFNFVDFEALRWLVVLPWTYLYKKSLKNQHNIVYYAAIILLRLEKPEQKRVVDKWWSSCGHEYQKILIETYKEHVFYYAAQNKEVNFELQENQKRMYICLEVLDRLNKSNEASKEPIDSSIFHIGDLFNRVQLDADFLVWSAKSQLYSDPNNPELRQLPMDFENTLSPFCNYSFVFDGASKSAVLQADSRAQKMIAIEMTNFQNIMSLLRSTPPENWFLIIQVSRNNIVSDTMHQLSMVDDIELKKPIKIAFKGEDGMDAGGVRKEYFMLLMKDLMNPIYGMFTYHEESRLLWFNSDSLESDRMFGMIGKVFGLAIYNNTIVNINVPLVLFKKILSSNSNPVSLDDMMELQPTVARSLQAILDYEGDDFEDVFSLTFEITRPYYDGTKSVFLDEKDPHKVLRRSNREEYVNAYLNYTFNTSVELQFKAFKKGFLQVCGGKILEFFKPKELQSLVIGNDHYDWDLLKKNTTYKDCKEEDNLVKNFWRVFSQLSQEQKKNFLLFLTGCDRVPITGMQTIPMVIQAVNSPTNHLPVAHTCFNILDLPRYRDEKTLRTKLLQAIDNAEGFGLA